MKFAASLLTMLFAAGVWAEEYAGKVLWGLATRKVPAAEVPAAAGLVPDDQEFLLLVRFAAPGATGEAEGVRAGDYFLRLGGGKPDEFNISAVSGSRGGGLAPGDLIPAELLRLADGAPEVLKLELRAARYYDTVRAEHVEPEGASEFAGFTSEFRTAAEPFIEANGWSAAITDLLQRLENIDLYRDPYRLPLFSYLARNPFHVEALSRSAVGRAQAAENRPAALLELAQWLLRFAPPALPEEFAVPAFEDGDLDAHLDYVETVLARCAEYNARAFAAVTPEERDFVLEHREALLDAFVKYKTPVNDPDTGRTRRTLEVCRILNRIDFSWLYAQACLASVLAGDDFTASLKKAALAAGDAPVIAARDTAWGRIVVAGTGRNLHTDDCAALYDLGGDDVYFNNQGGSLPGSIPTAVLVDYHGDDCYESTDPLSQGGGNFGVGILRDLAGDDIYIGIREVQGAAFGGVGMLFDEGGDDLYRAMDTAQAAAFFGVGILADRAGGDRYESHRNSQGVGFPRGIGILSDLNGDDSYYCKGASQTTYDTRGHFEGWGQGLGFGMRPYASGGVGLLFDGGGRDRYEAGTFAQGGGYFYAFGLLSDLGDEDDLYIATRYGQGFGCHQAFGAFIEAGGDDTYQTRHGVAPGLAWDESVGLFLDDGGDDHYDGSGFFSLGAAAQNGLSLFLERSGDDVYDGPRPAVVAGNDYHGGASLSVFIDDGGGLDRYQQRSNDCVEVEPEYSVFIDR